MKVTYTGSFYRWRILGVQVAPGKVQVRPASSRVLGIYINLLQMSLLDSVWATANSNRVGVEATVHVPIDSCCLWLVWRCRLHHAASVVKLSWSHVFAPPHRPLLFNLQAFCHQNQLVQIILWCMECTAFLLKRNKLHWPLRSTYSLTRQVARQYWTLIAGSKSSDRKSVVCGKKKKKKKKCCLS